jgi:hypothetical protein
VEKVTALEDFATTDRQREIILAVATEGGAAAAARKLDLSRGTVTNIMKVVRDKAARQGWSPEHDMTRIVPDGYRVRGVSTYYGRDGTMRGQWVKSQVDRERQHELMVEAVKGLTDAMPRARALKAPKIDTDALMAVYPVGDHHLGMLSWGEETGADYDLDSGENLLCGAISHLANTAPACETALLAIVGDFFHYDSMEAVTPKNRNELDSDTRYPRMVRTGMRVIRFNVETLLRRHAIVKIIVERGNHDESSSVFLREALAQIFEGEPRIIVDTSPSAFHYERFGKNLVGVTHGDTVKMDKLPLIMAADRPRDWGETEYRLWLTGHVHHESRKDFEGCTVESLRILPPVDAYAHSHGYRSQRDMKCIVLHAEYGEQGRNIVNPAMLA